MTWESWYKIGLSALPTMFTILGLWLYWGENPLPALAPNLGFWGVVIAFYLFTHIYLPNKRSPFYLTVCTACLWLVSSITSRNLARFLASDEYTGALSVLRSKDFWYSYVMSTLALVIPLSQFIRHEPRIVAESERVGKSAGEEG